MPHYVKLHSAIWDNPKFLALASSEARLSYIRVLAAGKAADPEGQWPTRDYLDASLRSDPWALAHVDALFDADLLRTDPDGRVRVPQWGFWQAWEGKRPAGQLATEAPALLETRRAKDARRKRIREWVAKGPDRVEDCPEDIREEVRTRLQTPNLRGGSAEGRDHTDGQTDGVSPYTSETSAEGDAARPSSSADMSGESGTCPWHGTPFRASQFPNGKPYCPRDAVPHGPRDAKGRCGAKGESVAATAEPVAVRKCWDCEQSIAPSDEASVVIVGNTTGELYCNGCAGRSGRPSWLVRRGPCTTCDEPLDFWSGEVVNDGGWGMHAHHRDEASV